MSTNNWSTECPTEPGTYQMRCMENNHQSERIKVSERDGELFAECPDLGTIPLSYYHEGLTEIEWMRDE